MKYIIALIGAMCIAYLMPVSLLALGFEGTIQVYLPSVTASVVTALGILLALEVNQVKDI